MLRRLSALCVLFAILAAVGCGGKPFASPEAALETYVKAYNATDKQAMARCGDDVDVRTIFRTTEEDLLGEDIPVPVEAIEFKIISVDQRPRATITNYYLTEDAWIEAEFRSPSDPKFREVATVRLVNRSHSFYMEDPHWQIVPLRGD
jgi:hypothetical protein